MSPVFAPVACGRWPDCEPGAHCSYGTCQVAVMSPLFAPVACGRWPDREPGAKEV